jgi:predicted Zn-ribbon and HTH transcriptional regulator
MHACQSRCAFWSVFACKASLLICIALIVASFFIPYRQLMVVTPTGVYVGFDDAVRQQHPIRMPHWLAIGLTAMPALLWHIANRRERARRNNGKWLAQWKICGKCGYDLRATPERCPECGAVPAETAAP